MSDLDILCPILAMEARLEGRRSRGRPRETYVDGIEEVGRKDKLDTN